jgi:hypothetical protein
MGPQGTQGVQGAQGPAGPTGPSGVINVSSFDVSNWATSLTASSAIAPAICRVTSYTPTTTGQVAIIQISGTALMTPVATATQLYMAAVVSTDGGATFSFAGSTYAVDELNTGAANVGSVIRVPLTQGTSYIFGAGFLSNVTTTLTGTTCMGVVQIVKN